MSELPKMIKIDEFSIVLLVNAPEYYLTLIKQIARHVDTSPKSDTLYSFIQIFYIHSSDLTQNFPTYKIRLSETGKLWSSWPKAKQLDTDLTLDTVIKIGYVNGLVESNNIRIDDIWTSLKFTRPKPGKIYNNSHAKLIY